MSKVFNMVGGGGGKNISSIIITGRESTDTVTCTKDGKSYTATWDETEQHWEIVGLPLGTFIITATNGSKTVEKTVLIDIAGVYEIEMEFRLYLYQYGDECEDITGGWLTGSNVQNIISNATDGTKENDYLLVSQPQSTPAHNEGFRTANAIDFTGYSHINIEIEASLNKNSTYTTGFVLRLNKTAPISTNNLRSGSILVQDSGDAYDTFEQSGDYSGILSAPLPPVALSCTSPAYVCFWTGHYWPGGTSAGGSVKVKSIFLTE